jgi:transposase
VIVTSGQRNDGTQLFAVLDPIRVPRKGRGRPRKRPECLLADRGYGKGLYRRTLRGRGIPHIIPEREDHRERRAKRPGRPLLFDADLYAKRNVVERCVNRLKQWRGIATRYDKRAANYRAMVVIASLMIWLAP